MTTRLRRLAALLDGHGLDTRTLPHSVEVCNPVNGWLNDTIRCTGDGYLTSSGYEIGEVGDETETAHRVAFLLGVPHA